MGNLRNMQKRAETLGMWVDHATPYGPTKAGAILYRYHLGAIGWQADAGCDSLSEVADYLGCTALLRGED
jgi:hypothetical protein